MRAAAFVSISPQHTAAKFRYKTVRMRSKDLGFVHVSTTFESIDLMLPLDGTVAMLVRVQQARSLAIGRIAAAAWEAAQCSFVLKELTTNTKG